MFTATVKIADMQIIVNIILYNSMQDSKIQVYRFSQILCQQGLCYASKHDFKHFESEVSKNLAMGRQIKLRSQFLKSQALESKQYILQRMVQLYYEFRASLTDRTSIMHWMQDVSGDKIKIKYLFVLKICNKGKHISTNNLNI